MKKKSNSRRMTYDVRRTPIVRPLWIEVDLRALRANYRKICKFVGSKVKIIATIKQSAYGHGLIPVAKCLSKAGVSFFGVGSVEEACQLRKAGFKQRIVVLTAVLNKFCDYFIKYEITPTVVDLAFARKLSSLAAKKKKKISIHVKIDTGMGRLGKDVNDAHKFILSLSKLKNLRLEGLYTHFPVADTNFRFTNDQIKSFNEFIKNLEKEGVVFKYHHCANSVGIMNYPHSHFNMIRPGLILYGIESSTKAKLEVKPALSLKSRVIFIKRIKKGSGVSYGSAYVAKKPTYIATIAAGYADGYPWAVSNNGKAGVIIGDKMYKVAGRVCMDHTMIDLGNKKITPGQEVILLGSRGDLQITANDLALWAKTIPYEVVSRFSLKIPRMYKGI
ncbi:MAG: alanine racemase [Candidatus Omnitrophica bacterium]|nr:alanine racemase [Candidatus Omnitrophota bacterium]